MKRFFLACLLLLAAVPAFAQTVLTYSSAPGEFIGRGETRTFTTANYKMAFEGTRSAIHVIIQATDSYKRWDLELVAPLGEELSPGEYFLAEAASSATGRAPGLDFSGDSRGCNLVSGMFTIRQIKFDAYGRLSRLEATALQYCDPHLNPNPLAIEVRYRASYYMFGVDSAAEHLVGLGSHISYYNDTSVLSAKTNSYNAASIQLLASGMGDEWMVMIVAPPDQLRFTKGTFYTQAYPDGTFGKMLVQRTGRGCNPQSGVVNIIEVVYGPGDVFEKFYADFTHYCDSTSRLGPALKGRIRYVRGI
jgi:hypothetical protein